MTSSRIGRGAIVTLGAAASMAWAAGAANACETPPKPTTPTTHDHHHGKTPHTPSPNTVCEVHDSDVQYAELAKDGSVVGGWQNAAPGKFQRTSSEPVSGYQVRLNPEAGANCTGTVDVSLASYDTGGPTWETSGGAQSFVDYAHVQLSEQSPDTVSQKLTVKLPGAPGSTKCFGQIDLYFGSTIYDGGSGPGHGPVPDHDHKPKPVVTPTPDELITAWNGPDAGGCAVVTPPPPPVTTPPTTTPPTTPPTTSPTTHPSTTPTTPKSTPSTPATPATTTPGTPTLAHTGANVGEVSLVALAFFGAGGTAMFASRKAKAAAGARKH